MTTIPLTALERMEEQINLSSLYQRQNQLRLTVARGVWIVGCGGIGTWIAIIQAMMGTAYINLWDSDRVEESNRARLPYTPEDVGQLKTSVLANYIRRLRPDCEVSEHGAITKFDADCQPTIPALIYDCTDILTTQNMIFNWSRNKSQYIRAGYDGYHITVADSATGWSTSADTGGYRVTPSWIVPALICACLAVSKSATGLPNEFSGDIRDIVSPEDRTLRIDTTTDLGNYNHEQAFNELRGARAEQEEYDEENEEDEEE